MVDWNELQQSRFRHDQLRGDINSTQQKMASCDAPDDYDILKRLLDAERKLLEAYDMYIKHMERISQREAQDGQAQDA